MTLEQIVSRMARALSEITQDLHRTRISLYKPIHMPILQKIVQVGRRVVPRGWAPVIQAATRINPRLHRYTARMKSGDDLLIDLAQPMCLGYFFDGGVPHNCGLDRLMGHVLSPCLARTQNFTSINDA